MGRKSIFVDMGILVVVLSLFSTMSSYSEEVRGVTGDTIKIGVIVDLSGPFTAATVPIKEAITTYFKYVNDVDGIHRRRVKLIVEDDRYAIPPAIDRMKEITLKYYPGIKPPSQFYTMGWNMANIFTEGLKRAGKNLTSETFVGSLETLKDFNSQGISAPVTYTFSSHKPNEYSKFFKADVEKERLVSLTGWLKPAH
ncbi:MAG: ABC transporter substrate-binding protein [Desulfobacteria bacterium]